MDEGRAAFTVNPRNSESSKDEDNDEREANLFRRGIIDAGQVPAGRCGRVELDLLGDDKFLLDLAKKYSVSLQALTFRLTYLRYIAE
jgi:Zn-dependent peptidase ImmA (M78 family)